MKAATRFSILLLAVLGDAVCVRAQGTAFTYQGRLNDNGGPATGIYDLRFTAQAAATGPVNIGSPVTATAVPVSNGLFTVMLDFGSGVFEGLPRWLEIAVRTNGAASFVTLSPRQALTPAPYAIHAGTASNVAPGSAVTSLNNLRDNISLVAGANVTLTPSGNTLTISAPGGGGGGPWLLDGANAYYNAGNVGVGTSIPTTKFTVHDPLFGIEHTDGTVRLATYLDSLGGWLGTMSNHRLHFYVNNGALPSMTVDTAGNVGIGTISPAAKLDVRGSLVMEGGGNPGLFTAASGGEQNRYLSLLNSPTLQSASGLKAGGILVSDSYDYANPGKNELVVKGNVRVGGDAAQNRDKGGWVKAMAKVNADGSIARQFSAFGGSITAQFVGGVPKYFVTFPFRVDDRFIQLTPFFNSSVGSVKASIHSFPSANSVEISLTDTIEDVQSDVIDSFVANEFFIFVY